MKKITLVKTEVNFYKQVVFSTHVDLEYFWELVSQKSTRIQNFITDNKSHYSEVEYLVADIFFYLFKKYPVLNEVETISSSSIPNLVVLNTLCKNENIQEIKVVTSHDEFSSLLATESLLSDVLNAINTLLENHKEELTRIEQIKEEIKKTNQGELTLEKSLEKLKEFQKSLEENSSELVLKTLKNSIDFTVNEIVGISENISQWGLGSDNTYQKLPYEEKFKISKKLVNSEKLKEIAKLAGKVKNLAFKKGNTNFKKAQSEVKSVEYGNNLSKTVFSEFIKLGSPELKSTFFKDYSKKRLLQVKYGGKTELGMGPIVVCLDSSGSMSGVKEIWAKAVCLSLVEICKKGHRNLIVIHFSSRYNFHSTLKLNFIGKSNHYSRMEILNMAEYFEGGGTEYEPVLQKSINTINSEPKFKKADIVFITDGESPIDNKFVSSFNDWKKLKKVSVTSCLIGAGSAWSGDTTLNLFSDSVQNFNLLSDSKEQLALKLFKTFI